MTVMMTGSLFRTMAGVGQGCTRVKCLRLREREREREQRAERERQGFLVLALPCPAIWARASQVPCRSGTLEIIKNVTNTIDNRYKLLLMFHPSIMI